jgi:cytosine/adenosine deaminase-related metal-dependent hydrolase
MRLTIAADALVSVRGVIGDSKLVIDSGKLKGVVRRNEEVEDVELELGGSGRVATPSFVSVHTFLTLYPFRFSVFNGLKNATELYSVMTSNDAYYFALLASYHLARTGVSSVVFSDPYPDTVARAVQEVGLRPYIAVGVGCPESRSDWKNEFNVLFQRWSAKGRRDVMLKLCTDEELDEVFAVAREAKTLLVVDRTVPLHELETKGYIREVPILALGGGTRSDASLIKKYGIHVAFTPSFEVSKFPLSQYDPAISLDLTPKYDIRHEMSVAVLRLMLKPDEAFKASTVNGCEVLQLDCGTFENGAEADVAVFEFREPPSYPFEPASPYESLVFSGCSLETLVVKGEPVVDGGVPLNVGLAQVEEATGRVQEVDKRAGQKVRNVATNRDLE